VPEGGRVLEPCAGIGHLFAAVRHEWWFDDESVTVDAYELEEVCVNLGRMLWPGVCWHHEIPFDTLPEITGRYDLVLMNPPFGTTRGMYGGRDEMTGAEVSRSEHVFLWLMALALKPGGHGLVILPYNTWSKIPKSTKPWFEERLTLKNQWGPLPGEFRHSKSMRVHGYVFRRTPYDVPQATERPGDARSGDIGISTGMDAVPPVSEPGTLPDTLKEVTADEVTISVADPPDDDGAVAVAYVDDSVWLRVRHGSEVLMPDEVTVEPVAYREGSSILGYWPAVKVRGRIVTAAVRARDMSPHGTLFDYELRRWLRETPEECMQFWREECESVYRDFDTRVWSRQVESALVRMPKESETCQTE
jgi:hypothetical protein